MKHWDHSIHQHVLVYQGKELELFCFIFVKVIKKFMGSVFLRDGVTLYIITVLVVTNHVMGLCRTKCNIIWGELNICDRTII